MGVNQKSTADLAVTYISYTSVLTSTRSPYYDGGNSFRRQKLFEDFRSSDELNETDSDSDTITDSLMCVKEDNHEDFENERKLEGERKKQMI